MQENPFQNRENYSESTKFHIKVRKPYFKLRKTLFKGGLKINGKNKNILECDIEKEGGNIFLREFFLV